MKALTIREPWASLIIHGYKKYEFRSWKTNYRGKILIHAGKGIDKNILDRFKKYNLSYKSGAIIGEAILSDCILVTDSFINNLRLENPTVYCKSNYTEKYAWKLEDVVLYDEPIYVKGSLSLWNYNIK